MWKPNLPYFKCIPRYMETKLYTMFYFEVMKEDANFIGLPTY